MHFHCINFTDFHNSFSRQKFFEGIFRFKIKQEDFCGQKSCLIKTEYQKLFVPGAVFAPCSAGTSGIGMVHISCIGTGACSYSATIVHCTGVRPCCSSSGSGSRATVVQRINTCSSSCRICCAARTAWIIAAKGCKRDSRYKQYSSHGFSFY